MNDNSRRLLSLPEIALRELRLDPKFNDQDDNNLVAELVEKPISEEVIKMKSEGSSAKKKDSLKQDEALFFNLKKASYKEGKYNKENKQKTNFSSVEFRHKYVAVVVADGDRVGKKITQICESGESEGKLRTFSKELIAFNQKAVQDIIDYGGCLLYTSPSPRDRG